MKLVEKYSTGKAARFDSRTLQTMNRAVRAVIIPRMKFITTNKHFGSFDQPIFSDENCWVHKIFEQLGSLNNASDF